MVDCVWLHDAVADSDEDVIPGWLRDFLGLKPGRAIGKHWEFHDITQPDLVESRTTHRAKPRNSVYIKARKTVCQACNNEWMSEIQRDAKEFIKRMIRGKTLNLRTGHQAALGDWGAMTGTMLEYAHGDTVDALRRSIFYAWHSAPPNTIVLLCSVPKPEEPPMPVAVSDTHTVNPQNGQIVVHQEIIIAGGVGFVVLQGLLHPRQLGVLNDHRAFFIQVWPPALEPRRWPPTAPLPDITHLMLLGQKILKGG
jgi:hypothetical protein